VLTGAVLLPVTWAVVVHSTSVMTWAAIGLALSAAALLGISIPWSMLLVGVNDVCYNMESMVLKDVRACPFPCLHYKFP
jgi:hypothetical protein